MLFPTFHSHSPLKAHIMDTLNLQQLGRVWLLLVMAGCLMGACKPDDTPTGIAIEPSISLLETNKTTVQAFVEPLVFKIEYTDGDGDLGTNDDTQRNVFVEDSRIGTTQSFRLQQLAPDGATIPITGTFSLELPFTILTDSVETETARFSMYVVDQAGHASNVVESEAITITR